MKNSYETQNYKVVDWLCNANNTEIAKSRTDLRISEKIIILNQIWFDRVANYYNKEDKLKILSAGCGLGDELMDLLEDHTPYFDKEINCLDESVGIEINPLLCKIANNYMNPKTNSHNKNYLKTNKKISIINGDFFNMPFENNEFNYSVLNTGTIGNFNDDKKIELIKELTRVTSRIAFVTFFDPSENATKKRIEMYEQEGVQGEHKITQKKYSTGGTSTRIAYEKMGLFSEAMSLDRFDYLVSKAGNASVSYLQLTDFSRMAKIYPIK